MRAYGGSPSLAGYFLADEPHPDDAPVWAPLARRLRALDPAHPAYVNFLPISREEAGLATARARWRDDVAAAVKAGELGLFTFDAYAFPVSGGERPHYLATLREASRVSREIGVPFGAARSTPACIRPQRRPNGLVKR